MGLSDEVTGEWTELHNEELNDRYLTKYYSGYQTENNEMGGAQVAATCKCGNEPSGSVKCEEFLD